MPRRSLVLAGQVVGLFAYLPSLGQRLRPGASGGRHQRILIETLYGRTVEDCVLWLSVCPMERLSRKKRTKVLRCGSDISTGTSLPSILDRLPWSARIRLSKPRPKVRLSSPPLPATHLAGVSHDGRTGIRNPICCDVCCVERSAFDSERGSCSALQKTKRVKHEDVDTSRVGLSRDVCTCGGADELRPHSH